MRPASGPVQNPSAATAADMDLDPALEVFKLRGFDITDSYSSNYLLFVPSRVMYQIADVFVFRNRTFETFCFINQWAMKT